MKQVFRFPIVFLSLFFLTGEKTNAQTPDWIWAKATGGTNSDFAYSLSVDTAGNGDVYTTGWFTGTVDFDPDSSTTLNLTAAGAQDVFISKLDGSGNLIWAKQMGGAVGGTVGFSIIVDPFGSGDVYTTGTFNGTADFDPGAGIFNFTSAGYRDIFISKLDKTGNFIWAKQLGGTGDDYARAIAVDPSGSRNIYIGGYFEGTGDFDPGAGTYYITSTGLFDILICKLDGSGNFIWARQMGGIDYDAAFGIAPDNFGNVYTTGSFYETADFNPGSGTFYLTAYVGGSDIFISKLDSAGNFVWAKAMYGTGSIDQGNNLTLDAAYNVYATGRFEGTADFDAGPGTFNLSSSGIGDIFISKSDSAGNFLWANAMGSTSNDFGYTIAIDNRRNGDVYSAGLFQGTVDFDPGAGIFNLTSAGLADIFISKSDSAGNFLWAKSVGGTADDQTYSIALDTQSAIYMTGFFNSPIITFGSTILTNIVNTGNVPDFFVAKLDSAISTGNNELINLLNDFYLFPNPATNGFTVSFAGRQKKVEIIVTDIRGKIIYAGTSKDLQEIKVSTKNISEGVYVLQVLTSEGIITKKFIVAK